MTTTMPVTLQDNCTAAFHQIAEGEMVPPSWTGAHVALRLAEAFTTLRCQPVSGDDIRMSLQTKWPPYMYEFEDLLAQAELDEPEERRPAPMPPTARAISNMNAAVAWVMIYLRHHPELCEAVNAVARAHSLGLDVGFVARERGGCADDWRRRHDVGCELIAAGLIRDQVRVF